MSRAARARKIVTSTARRVGERVAARGIGSRSIGESVMRAMPARYRPDRVSIVVPVYNVETYLASCLDSILRQTYRNLEVIIIDDGATDGSLGIAQEYARSDARIRLRSQANAGLSAARNAGAALSRGKYLWFIDSDDILPETAVEKLVSTLRKTGSDFAVGCYCRFNSRETWSAGSWIREAHQRSRHGITLRDYPTILVNAVAWSKMYRRQFWVENDLAFPVGALYEDQPVSARAYAIAKSFDVVSDVIYNWRVREDKSSISQQSFEFFDLDARLDSAKASLRILKEISGEDAAIERATQLLSNDIGHSMRHIADTDEQFWHRLSAGIANIASYIPDKNWQRVPAHLAVFEWLLMQEQYELVRRLVANGAMDSNVWGTIRRDDEIELAPIANIEWDSIPAVVRTIPERQITLLTALRRSHWARPGVLVLEGWAYLTMVPDSVSSMNRELVLEDPSGDAIATLQLTAQRDPDIDRISGNQVLDFRDFGFRCEIDADRLGLPESDAIGLRVNVYSAGRKYSDVIVNVNRWSSLSTSGVSTSSEGRTMSLTFDRELGPVLRVRHKQILLTAADRKSVV